MAIMSVEASVLTLGVTMGAAETLVVRLVALVAVLLSPSCMGRSRHPSSGAMRGERAFSSDCWEACPSASYAFPSMTEHIQLLWRDIYMDKGS